MTLQSLPRSAATGLAVLAFAVICQPLAEATKPDLDGKVVLANLDRYNVVLKLGDKKKEVLPRKATALSPKKYPISLEYWSGNKKTGWAKQSIDAAGTYAFNFKNGTWSLRALKKRAPGDPVTVRKPAVPVKRGTPNRFVPGSGARVVNKPRTIVRPGRSPVVNVDRRFWHPLARVAWAGMSLYSFIRSEEDRDILRDMIIHGRDVDRVEFEEYLRDADLAEHHRLDMMNAYDELARLSDSDWKDIEDASDEDWLRAREDLGDLVDDNAWDDVVDDINDIDDGDFFDEDADLDFDDLADTLEEDIDVDDIDVGDIGFDDVDLDLGDMDIGDIGIDDNSFDLGGFDDVVSGDSFVEDNMLDQGGFDNIGDGGYIDGGFDQDLGGFGDDFGGGFDGGGFDGGGFDDF